MSDQSGNSAGSSAGSSAVNNGENADKKRAQSTLMLLVIGFVLDALLFGIVSLATRVGSTASDLAVAGLAVRQVEPSNQVAIELAAANHMSYFPSFMGWVAFVVLSALLWSVIIRKIVKSK